MIGKIDFKCTFCYFLNPAGIAVEGDGGGEVLV